MRKIRLSLAPSALAVSLMFCTPGFAQTSPASQIAPILPAAVTLNLMTADGMAVLDAQWKNMDARIVEVPAMEREVDTWPMAYDIDPHAGGSDYDDSHWPVIPAEALAERRGGGRIFFTWYRTTLTIPERIGDFETAGSSVVLDLTVDDYGEVWVNAHRGDVVLAWRMPMHRAAIVFSLNLMLMMGLGGQASAQGWVEYVNIEERFGINYPGEPAQTQGTHTTISGRTFPTQIFTASDSAGTYTVTVVN
ncbi:MAG: hypothetical protein V3S07_07250 [Micropepsaceae bacterium]